MNLQVKEFNDEMNELIAFLTSETWEFHGTPNPKPERIQASYENQFYTGDDCKSFWVISDQDTKIGFVRIYDLQDGTPLFDIRISSKHRGAGIGTKTIQWLVDYIFENYSDKDRIEATTREDNFAMRCVFHKCGFVKEAHYRNAWGGSNNKLYAAIGYGITKEDWLNKKTTPVNWNDFKC